jgi:hypothetical protein
VTISAARLTVSVTHDEAGVQFLDGLRRREAAFCHIDDRVTRYGDDALHIFDYIVFGVLIAIMLGGGTAWWGRF